MTALEMHLVALGKKGEDGLNILKKLFSDFQFDILPFDEKQLMIAVEAYRTFGKGRHKAGLNFGDCAAYALAKSYELPLLFKGDDFPETDIDICPLAQRLR